MIPLGKIEKMWIQALTDAADDSSVVGDRYEFRINPESFNLKYELEYVDEAAAGSSGSAQKYYQQKANEWEFDILIDGTGVIKDASILDIAILGSAEPVDVQAEVEVLKGIAVNYDGDIHRNHYLKITWGDRIFKGTLLSLDLNYKLFNTDGSPLRVIAKLKLKEWVNPDLRIMADGPSSPDITHERTFKAEDKFDLMAHKIYKDSKYYFDVAKYNNLNGFRKIAIGTKINFPPVK